MLYPIRHTSQRLSTCWTTTAAVFAVFSILISTGLLIVTEEIHFLVGQFGLPKWWGPGVYVVAGILFLMLVSQVGSVIWSCGQDTTTHGWEVYFMAAAGTQVLFHLFLHLPLLHIGYAVKHENYLIFFVEFVQFVNLSGAFVTLIQTIALIIHFHSEKDYDYYPLDNYALRHPGLYLP